MRLHDWKEPLIKCVRITCRGIIILCIIILGLPYSQITGWWCIDDIFSVSCLRHMQMVPMTFPYWKQRLFDREKIFFVKHFTRIFPFVLRYSFHIRQALILVMPVESASLAIEFLMCGKQQACSCINLSNSFCPKRTWLPCAQLFLSHDRYARLDSAIIPLCLNYM